MVELADDSEVVIKHRQDFDLEHIEDKRATFRLNFVPNDPGVFDSGIRIYAKNNELPHRMDFNLVRWV